MNLGNVLIFGDSYSTFKDAVPEGYEVYYTTKREAGPNITEINDTWWHSLISETGSSLVLNDSWSGSTICYTGYSGADTSKTSSFICRLHRYIENGFFEQKKIDTVFIFGSTNDSWANSPLGALKYENIENEDLYSVLPAICYFIGRIKEMLPSANIVFIINTELKTAISSAIKEAAKYYGINSISLSDIDKDAGHPTVLGMKQIKEQVIAALTQN